MEVVGFGESDRLEAILRRIDVRSPGELPELRVSENVFVIPGLDALYTATGQRIDVSKRSFVPEDFAPAQATRIRVDDSYGKFCPPQVTIPNEFDDVEEAVLFGGHAWNHYGHFITDVMSRLWALYFTDNKAPILFLDRTATSFDGTPFSKMVADSLDISKRLFCCRRPTRLKQVYLPEPSIQHAFRIFHTHPKPHIDVARKLSADKSDKFRGRLVYLTRSGLRSTLRHSEQEPILEQKLRNIGFDIMYPERMSFIDQVELFNNAALVAGMTGSAFHTCLFSLPGRTPKLVHLCWNKINQRYIMIDIVKGICSTYVKVGEIHGISEKMRVERINLDLDMSYSAISKAVKNM